MNELQPPQQQNDDHILCVLGFFGKFYPSKGISWALAKGTVERPLCKLYPPHLVQHGDEHCAMVCPHQSTSTGRKIKPQFGLDSATISYPSMEDHNTSSGC